MKPFPLIIAALSLTLSLCSCAKPLTSPQIKAATTDDLDSERTYALLTNDTARFCRVNWEMVDRDEKGGTVYTPDQRRDAISGNITKGMTTSMVRAALGRPRSIYTTTSTLGETEVWVYELPHRQYQQVFFYAGQVSYSEHTQHSGF